MPSPDRSRRPQGEPSLSDRGAGPARGALLALAVFVALGALAPWLARERPIATLHPGGARRAVHAPIPYDPNGLRLSESLEPPSLRHPCGTDLLGRDLASRLLHGTRVALVVGAGSTLLALLFGTALGGAAGLAGGAAEIALGRVIEVFGCFPPLLLALAFQAAGRGTGLLALILAIGLGRTAASARFLRGEVRRLRAAPFFTAARASGASLPRAAWTHLGPILKGPLVVQATFGVSQALLLESGLSFLGLGVEPPTPSWGQMLGEARGTMTAAWWTVAFPASALALTLILLNVVPRLWQRKEVDNIAA
ncbi:MAG TPA: ABC transporter permease [Candidatus Polarisedimenticolia bacterium]|nr:ABC transporter permease [Candidatus Polarisedimenticolia bacterium]